MIRGADLCAASVSAVAVFLDFLASAELLELFALVLSFLLAFSLPSLSGLSFFDPFVFASVLLLSFLPISLLSFFLFDRPCL
jgi:hypothetical protein